MTHFRTNDVDCQGTSRGRVVLLLALAATCFLGPATEISRNSLHAAELGWRVGTASVDITPVHPIRLTGYGNRRDEATQVAQRIYAKGIAFSSLGPNGQAELPAIWLTFENCGVTTAIHTEVAKRLHDKLGIPSARLNISVTHTHTGPTLKDWAPFIFSEDIPPNHQANIDRYTEKLVDDLVAVATQAVSAQQPATLVWGTGKVSFARNRRLLNEGKWQNFGEQSGGPVDHSLPLLVAKNANGELLACVATYACHCTTLAADFNQIAGDWAGSAQMAIEKMFPDCTAIINIGCGADANPHPRGSELSICDQQGEQVALEVQRLLGTKLTELRSPLVCQAEWIDLPFERARTREDWELLAKEEGAAGYHARSFLKRLGAAEELPTKLPYPISVWTFADDLAMVFLGGEVVVDYALRLRELFDPSRLWVVAYTNDVPCYIPSARILREGGYEADSSMYFYARPQRLAPECEDYLVDTVQRLMPHAFYGEKLRTDFPGPKSAQETCDSIRLPEGFRAKIAAAEPLIEDPVAIDWGPDGSLYVVEMRDYPNGLTWFQQGDPIGVPGGRVKLLRDTDGDGVYDKSTVFADELSFPCGIKFWRKGVLVSSAPSIWYLEDTNGDDVADTKTSFFSGFTGGNPQHRANGMAWGLDNWLYVANGEAVGTIRADATGNAVEINGRDMSIRPDEGDLQTESGRTQYGRCRDDFNSWFGGNNCDPLWHYVLDDRYLRRNPHFIPPSVRRDVPEVPGAGPVFPASRTLARFNDFYAADRFTSACSPEVYRDTRLASLLGEDATHVFVCEPVHNLVHREVLQPEGVTFRSRRAETEQSSEFLASTDNWCRPVAARTGPDGAIWVVDMYRQVLEHPEWIPWLWQRKLDLRAGTQQGRIYRIFNTSTEPGSGTKSEMPKLDQLTPSELVQRLAHPNGWQRDMAQQMLLWSKDASIAPELAQLATKSPIALGRLHALYTLEGLQKLSDEVLMTAFRDPHPGVRKHALRLADRRLREGQTFLKEVIRLKDDRDPDLRMQVAYTLGESSNPEAGKALANLAEQSVEDPYMTAAVMSSLHRDNIRSFTAVWTNSPKSSDELSSHILDVAVGLRDKESIALLVKQQLDRSEAEAPSGRFAAATRLAAALDDDELMASLDGSLRQRLSARIAAAVRTIIISSQFPGNERIAKTVDDEVMLLAAVKLVGSARSSDESDADALGSLIAPTVSPAVQLAAIDAIAARFPSQLASITLRDWSAHGPAIRRGILDAIQENEIAIAPFLDAIESGAVPKGQLDARVRQWLMTSDDPAVKTRAEHIFGKSSSSELDSVIAKYVEAASNSGNPQIGKEVFAKRCATCHRMNELGHIVGPDLATLTDRSPQALVTAVLDPNRALEARFIEYVASADDGRQVTGIIKEETSTSVTLLGPDGKEEVLSRNGIEALQSNGRSLMPEGLEKDISPSECADLIAFVRATAVPPKQFPGNQPELAHVRDDGSIRLLALNAKIFGPTLVFEDKYRNLGHWQSADDYAVWMINVPEAGTYHVHLDYACDDASQGGRYTITVQDQTVGGTVRGTGSWDTYSDCWSGTLILPEGYAELIMRSDGPIPHALIDLRQIVLAPDE
jgi:putative membrane-bound dehydrogenase-like protein